MDNMPDYVDMYKKMLGVSDKKSKYELLQEKVSKILIFLHLKKPKKPKHATQEEIAAYTDRWKRLENYHQEKIQSMNDSMATVNPIALPDINGDRFFVDPTTGFLVKYHTLSNTNTDILENKE